MGKFEDLTGKRYGRLTVIKRVHKDGEKCSHWLCKCDCGNETTVIACNLKAGRTQSCGCLNREAAKTAHTTHGHTGTRIYNVYHKMIDRTINPNDKSYKDYGGRGIKICDEWLNDFVSFYNWSIANGYKDGLTIDRIDVNGGYNPQNCRWATPKDQANNRRSNVNITYKGQTQTMMQWAELLNINYITLWKRIKQYHWSIERAFTQ